MNRKPYASDVRDDAGALVAPDLTLRSEAAPQREYPLREVFNGLRWLVRSGAAWRRMPHDRPPGQVVYDQTPCGLTAGVCAARVHDLRARWRLAAGRDEPPSAASLDSRTWPSRPDSGPRAG